MTGKHCTCPCGHKKAQLHHGNLKYKDTCHACVFADGRPVPVGWTTVSTLKKKLEGYENVSIVTGANVKKILSGNTRWQMEPGVDGVEYETLVCNDDDDDKKEEVKLVTVDADAVILASGKG